MALSRSSIRRGGTDTKAEERGGRGPDFEGIKREEVEGKLLEVEHGTISEPGHTQIVYTVFLLFFYP